MTTPLRSSVASFEPGFDEISDATRALLDAARSDDAPGMESALANGANMEARAGPKDWPIGREGPRALHVALRVGAHNAARWLLAHGADAAGLSGGPDPTRPLAWCHDHELALEIMERGGYGVNPALRESCDFSRFAAYPDQKEGAERAPGWQKAFFARFVALGGDLEARDSEGRTALRRAADSMRLRGIAELLALGADPNAVDNNGRPLLRAAANNLTQTGYRTRPYKTIVALVAGGADPAFLDKEGRPPHQSLKDFAWNHLPEWERAVKEGELTRERKELKEASARAGIKRASKKPRL